MDTSWRRCISVCFPPHEVRPVSEILRFPFRNVRVFNFHATNKHQRGSKDPTVFLAFCIKLLLLIQSSGGAVSITYSSAMSSIEREMRVGVRTEVDHAITGVNRHTGVTPAKGRSHNVADRDVAFQNRAKSCTGHPTHRVAPDGNGGYKDRLTDCYICGMSTKHYCIGCNRPLCFGGVGGKSAGKRIEKIKERMKDKHPNVKSLDPNNPPANIKEIGEGNFIYNCCF